MCRSQAEFRFLKLLSFIGAGSLAQAQKPGRPDFVPKRQRDPVAASLAASNTFKIRQAVQHLLDPENAGLGYVHAPPLTVEQQNFCSEVVLVDVLAGYPAKKFQFATRVRSLDREGRRNLSTLSLNCTLAAP